MLYYFAKQSSGEEFYQLHTPRYKGTWVHASSMTTEDMAVLVEKCELNDNIVRDVRDINELPRAEYSKGKLYVFLRLARQTQKGAIYTNPLLAIVGDHTYVTLDSSRNFSPEQLTALPLPVRSDEPTSLLLSTFAIVLAEYEQLVHHTGRSIKDIARRISRHEVGNKDFIRFVTIEDNLNECQMNLGGMQAVAQRLVENRHAVFDEVELEAIDDLLLHIQQLLVAVESHTQSITSIRNAYSTIANNTLNQRMKTLTVFTVLIALPNVFYGMYGMNVKLPFADEPWAYTVIVVFTILVIIGVYTIARRLKIF